MGMTREHHGICYRILKRWRLINNEYVLLKDYNIQTNIKGLVLDLNPESRGRVHLCPTGTLIIFMGFWWNGPSNFTIDTKSSIRGSLVHDTLYRLLRVEAVPWWVRDYADALLYRILLEDGMCGFRAMYWYKAVHEGGLSSALPGGG